MNSSSPFEQRRLAFVGLALAVLACGSAYLLWDKAHQRRLKDIPVFVGEMTFTEPYSVGVEGAKAPVWRASEFRITTDGTVEGMFEVDYSGAAMTQPPLADFLFAAVRAVYVAEPEHDTVSWPTSEVLAVPCSGVGPVVRCLLEGSFTPPPMRHGRKYERENLRWVYVTLTWVRVFRDGDGYLFQVFPGDGQPPRSNAIMFGAERASLSGTLGYSAPSREESLSRNREYTFDYVAWLRDHLAR